MYLIVFFSINILKSPHIRQCKLSKDSRMKKRGWGSGCSQRLVPSYLHFQGLVILRCLCVPSSKQCRIMLSDFNYANSHKRSKWLTKTFVKKQWFGSNYRPSSNVNRKTAEDQPHCNIKSKPCALIRFVKNWTKRLKMDN